MTKPIQLPPCRCRWRRCAATNVLSIQVADGPNGREFYFPASRNRKQAWAATGGMLFSCIMLAVVITRVPIAISLFVGLFVVITTLAFFDQWLTSYRPRHAVSAGGVRVLKRWLIPDARPDVWRG